MEISTNIHIYPVHAKKMITIIVYQTQKGMSAYFKILYKKRQMIQQKPLYFSVECVKI